MGEHRVVRAAEVLAAERERRRQLALDLGREEQLRTGSKLDSEREAQPDDEQVAQLSHPRGDENGSAEPITEQHRPEDASIEASQDEAAAQLNVGRASVQREEGEP